MRSSRLLRAWVPVVLWAGLIFGFSSVPDLGTGLGTWDLVLRKLAHFAEYAVLGVLLVRAIRRWPLAFAAGVLYAGSDELHQHFVPGRHAAFRDVAIDAAGVLAGLALARLVQSWYGAQRSRRPPAGRAAAAPRPADRGAARDEPATRRR